MNANELRLFALGASRAFGESVSARLAVPLSPHEEREFEDGEHKARPLVSGRGADVFVIHTLYGETGQSANDKLVRLLLFIGALKDAAAGRVTAVVPYLAYARKDRKTKARDPGGASPDKSAQVSKMDRRIQAAPRRSHSSARKASSSAVSRQAEVEGEFKAIDDLRPLRPRVAVGLDDVPFAYPLIEQRCGALEKGTLPCASGLDHRDRQCEFPRAQLCQVPHDARRKTLLVLALAHVERCAVTIKAAERAHDAPNVVDLHRAAADHAIQHPFGGQASHLHQPVNDAAVRSEPQLPVPVDRQRHGFEIDIVRQAAIEANLFGAVVPARRLGAEIEIALAYRLLQLPRVAVGEEHPRHVGLDGVDALGWLDVALRMGKKRDFPRKLGFARPWACGAARDRVVHLPIRRCRHYGPIRIRQIDANHRVVCPGDMAIAVAARLARIGLARSGTVLTTVKTAWSLAATMGTPTLASAGLRLGAGVSSSSHERERAVTAKAREFQREARDRVCAGLAPPGGKLPHAEAPSMEP